MNVVLSKLVKICHSVGDKWRLISSINLTESRLLKIYPSWYLHKQTVNAF